MCNGLDAISSGSVLTGTGFRSVAKPDLHSAMLVVKTHKQTRDCYVLERDRFGGGSFVVWGGKMGDQKRRHRLAYVQWARRHFIWQCVDWNRVSFSCETRFALSNAGGKNAQTNKGLLRAGKGSIWWGQFRGLGWKNG